MYPCTTFTIMPLFLYSYDFSSDEPLDRRQLFDGIRYMEADNVDDFLTKLLCSDKQFRRDVCLYADSREVYTDVLGELVVFLKTHTSSYFVYMTIESTRADL